MRHTFLKRALCVLIITAFVCTGIVPPSLAQSVVDLPKPGAMVPLTESFDPLLLKGMKVHSDDPLRFEFILDKGNTAADDEVREEESARLIRYFLAALTVPEGDLWVNLSPYEKDRIITEAFGQTEMGRDLLSQDYILKQITASLMHPEGDLGKGFWKDIYAKAYAAYGTTDVPVDTFHKVWIMPEKAVVYEGSPDGPGDAGPREAVAYVVAARLKVMLESDYLAAQQASPAAGAEGRSDGAPADIVKELIREVILPAIEKEVNEGRNFARLRQVYHSLILAAWYKRKIRDSLLSAVYVDRSKTDGVRIDDPGEAAKIWGQYVEAFRKGVYDFIREERDNYTEELIPRKYFSGGMKMDFSQSSLETVTALPEGELTSREPGQLIVSAVRLEAFSSEEMLHGKRQEPKKKADPGRHPLAVTGLQGNEADVIDARGQAQKIILAPMAANLPAVRAKVEAIEGTLPYSGLIASILQAFEGLPAAQRPGIYSFRETLKSVRDLVSPEHKVIAVRAAEAGSPFEAVTLFRAMTAYLVRSGVVTIEHDRDRDDNYLRIYVNGARFGMKVKGSAAKMLGTNINGAFRHESRLLNVLVRQVFSDQDEALSLQLRREDIGPDMEKFDHDVYSLLAEVSLLGDLNEERHPPEEDKRREDARIRALPLISEAVGSMRKDYVDIGPEMNMMGPMVTRDNFRLYDKSLQEAYEKADTILKNVLKGNGFSPGAMEVRIVGVGGKNAFVLKTVPYIIFVTADLLKGNPEDMIAAIMSHEIAHLIFHFKKILQGRWEKFYQRSTAGQEEHADILGLKLADRGGYNVNYLPKFFNEVPSSFPSIHNDSYHRSKNLFRYIQDTPFMNKSKEPAYRFSQYLDRVDEPETGITDVPRQDEWEAKKERLAGAFEAIQNRVRYIYENRSDDTVSDFHAAAGEFLEQLEAYREFLSDARAPLYVADLIGKISNIKRSFRMISFHGDHETKSRIGTALQETEAAVKQKFFSLGLKVEWYEFAVLPEKITSAGEEEAEYHAFLNDLMDDPEHFWGLLAAGLFGVRTFSLFLLPHEKFRAMRDVVGAEAYIGVIVDYISRLDGKGDAREAVHAFVDEVRSGGFPVDQIYVWVKKMSLGGYLNLAQEPFTAFINTLLPRLGEKAVELVMDLRYSSVKGFEGVLNTDQLRRISSALIRRLAQDYKDDDSYKLTDIIKLRKNDVELLTHIENEIDGQKDMDPYLKKRLHERITDAVYEGTFVPFFRLIYKENNNSYPSSSIRDLFGAGASEKDREAGLGLIDLLKRSFGEDTRMIIQGIGGMKFIPKGFKNALLLNFFRHASAGEKEREGRYRLLEETLKHMEFDDEDSARNRDGLSRMIESNIRDQRGLLMTQHDAYEYERLRQDKIFYDGKYYFIDAVTDIPEVQPDLMLITEAGQEDFMAWVRGQVPAGAGAAQRFEHLMEFLPRASPLRDIYLEPLIEEVMGQEVLDVPLARRMAAAFRSPDLAVSYQVKILDRDVSVLKGTGIAKDVMARSVLGKILDFFPKPSFVRDDLLDSYIEDYVEFLDDYRPVKQLYYSFYASDGRSIEGDQDEYVDAMVKQQNEVVFLMNKIPGYVQKVGFLLWVMGIQKQKPAVTRKIEMLLNLDLDHLQERFLKEMPLDNFRNIGKSVNGQIFHGFLWDEHNGLASDAEKGNRHGLWEEFVSALYEGTMGGKEGLMYDIWMSFFTIAPKHSWLLTEKTLLNLIMELARSGSGGEMSRDKQEELIVKFLQSVGVIGIKLGQVLHSFGYLEDSLGYRLESLKSKLPIPFSKREFFRFLDYYGIRGYRVKGLINEASIKAVYEVDRDGEKRVAKYKKPGGDRELTDGFALLQPVMADLDEKGYKKLPGYIIRFLKEYLTREMSFVQEHQNHLVLKQSLKGPASKARMYLNKARFLFNYFGSVREIRQYLKDQKVGIKMFDVDTPDQELVNPFLLDEEFIASSQDVPDDMRPFLRQTVIDLLSYEVMHTDLHEKNMIIDERQKIWVIDTASVKAIKLKTFLYLIKLLQVLQKKDRRDTFRVLRKLFPASARDRRWLLGVVDQSLRTGSSLEALLFITRQVAEYNYDFLESLKSIISLKHIFGLDQDPGSGEQDGRGLPGEEAPDQGPEAFSELTWEQLIETFKRTPSSMAEKKEKMIDEMLRRGEPSKDDLKSQRVSDLYALLLPFTVKKGASLPFRTKAMKAMKLLGNENLMYYSLYQNFVHMNVLNDMRQEFMDDPRKLLFTVKPGDAEVEDYLAELLYILQFHKFSDQEQEQLKDLVVGDGYNPALKKAAAMVLVNGTSPQVVEVLDALSVDTDSLVLEEAILTRMSQSQKGRDQFYGELKAFDSLVFKRYIGKRLSQVLEEGAITDLAYIHALIKVTLSPFQRQRREQAREDPSFGPEYHELVMPDILEKVNVRLDKLMQLAVKAGEAPEMKEAHRDLMAMFFIYIHLLDQQWSAPEADQGDLPRVVGATADFVAGLGDRCPDHIKGLDDEIFRQYLLVRLYLRTGRQTVHEKEYRSLFRGYYMRNMIGKRSLDEIHSFLYHLQEAESFFRQYPDQHREVGAFIIEDLQDRFHHYFNSLRDHKYDNRSHFVRLIELIRQYELLDLTGEMLSQKDLTGLNPGLLEFFDVIVDTLIQKVLAGNELHYTARDRWFTDLIFLTELLENFPRYFGLRQRIKGAVLAEKSISQGIKVQNSFYDNLSRFLKQQEAIEEVNMGRFAEDEARTEEEWKALLKEVDWQARDWVLRRVLAVMKNGSRAGEARLQQVQGGIDLNSVDGALAVSAAGPDFRFSVDPALFEQYQASPGFVPVITGMEELNDLPAFLGIPAGVN